MEVGVQADAEHKKDHTDLRELVEGLRVRAITGRERPYDHPGEEVTDDR